MYNKYPTSFDTYEEFERIFNSIPENDRLEWAESLDPKLLRMKMDNGRAVAHVLAKSGTLPEKFITEELLRMEDKDGWTVAHMLAHNRILPEKWITEDLLRTKMDNGWTVAHELVYNGTFPMEHLLSPDKRVSDELLRMKEYNFGWTVAHLLAKLGVFPEERITEDLLREKDRDGDTVAGYYYDYMYENNRWNLLTPAVLNAPYMGKTSVIAKLKKDLTKMSDSKLGSALVLMQRKTLLYLRSKVRNISLRDAIQKCLDRETDNEAFETSPDGNDTDLHTHGQEELYGAERGMQ